MNILEKLHQGLAQYHLLKHPFYQAWNEGCLSNATLQVYAKEYYYHVASFPRYISIIHSKCEDLKIRQILLDNLIEEEKGEDNHPELWKRFARGVGCLPHEMELEPKLDSTKALVDGYFDLMSCFFVGLGALYAYERQIPEIAQSKIRGLQSFYNISDAEVLQFFEVHIKADEWHSAECAALIKDLNLMEQEKAYEGAITGAKLLWQFLDGMMKVHEREGKVQSSV